MFFLFVLSAFVPAAMLAVLSYDHVRGVVSDYAQRQLAQASSGHSRALYDRLLGAHFILNANAAEIRSGLEAANTKQFALQRVFRRTYFVAHDRAALRSGPPLGDEPPRIDARAASHLAKGEVALLLPLLQPGSSVGYPWLAAPSIPPKRRRGSGC